MRAGRVLAATAVALATLPLGCGAPHAHAASTELVSVYADHFLPYTVSVERGGSLQFFDPDPWGNGEAPGHSVTELTPDTPRFDSGIVGLGKAAEVGGVSALPSGTYTFTCRIHPFMRGILIVR